MNYSKSSNREKASYSKSSEREKASYSKSSKRENASKVGEGGLGLECLDLGGCACVCRARRHREKEREKKRAKRIGGKSPATREGEPVVVVVEEKRVVDEEEKRVFVSRTGKKSLFICIFVHFCVRRDQKSHGLSSRIAARAAIRGGPGERQRIQQQGKCGRECERWSDGRRRKQYE